MKNMGKKIDRRVVKTKALLKKSLLEMLNESDIQTISIKELCELAGVNRTTFYKHYHSQYELFDEIQTDFLDAIETKFSNDLSDISSSERFTDVLAYIQAHSDLCLIFMRSDSDFSFETRLMMLPSVLRKAAIDAAKITPDQSEEQYSLAQLFVLDGCYYAIKRWLLRGCPESPAELCKMIRSLSQKIWDN